MPGVVRQNIDKHIGHASSTANPFHQTPYSTAGQSKVLAENANVVVVPGGQTGCGDPASGKSGKVFAGGAGKGVHRKGDDTSGHGSWPGNAAQTGSSKVIAG